MKIKLTNRDAIGLYNALDGLNYRGVKFSFTIARNLNALKPIINAMDKALTVPKEFTEYEKKRVELAKKHADKDEKGNPKVEGHNFVITKMKEFEAELDTIQAEYKEVIDARQKQLDEYAALQDEEVEVELYKIHQSLLPAEISTKEVTAIYSIIDPDESIPSPFSKSQAGK